MQSADADKAAKRTAKMQAQADAMITGSGVAPKTTAVDFTKP